MWCAIFPGVLNHVKFAYFSLDTPLWPSGNYKPKIVFLRIHKAGSGNTAEILFRYKLDKLF